MTNVLEEITAYYSLFRNPEVAPDPTIFITHEREKYSDIPDDDYQIIRELATEIVEFLTNRKR